MQLAFDFLHRSENDSPHTTRSDIPGILSLVEQSFENDVDADEHPIYAKYSPDVVNEDVELIDLNGIEKVNERRSVSSGGDATRCRESKGSTNCPESERVMDDVEGVISEGETVIDVVLNEAVEGKSSHHGRTKKGGEGRSSSRAVGWEIAAGHRDKKRKLLRYALRFSRVKI